MTTQEKLSAMLASIKNILNDNTERETKSLRMFGLIRNMSPTDLIDIEIEMKKSGNKPEYGYADKHFLSILGIVTEGKRLALQ